MAEHFGDRLVRAIRDRNAPACVGLDPLLDRLPTELLDAHGIAPGADPDAVEWRRAAAALYDFGHAVITQTADLVPTIKINIAFFERFHADGIRAYDRLVRLAQAKGLIVIGDVKRADIGHSSTQYARAQLAPIAPANGTEHATPDSITVNPYFGYDTIAPFADVARAHGRGFFVLVQTSNETAASVQGLTLSDGQLLSDHVAGMVEEWATQEGLVGAEGYSCVGAVVSPRDLPATERIRSLMPHAIFLVPGFGAQGRTAQEVAKCFKSDGSGAIVTASRSVIYAYQHEVTRAAAGDDWRACIRRGCTDFVEAIRGVLQNQR